MAVTALACDPVNEEPPQFVERPKTVLVYMAANNNLSSQAENNLASMKQGFVPENENLLVYMHLASKNPVLLRLFKDETGAVVQDTVYHFRFQDIVWYWMDLEYEQELLNGKYAGQEVTQFTDEENRKRHRWETLAEGVWEFEISFGQLEFVEGELLETYE